MITEGLLILGTLFFLLVGAGGLTSLSRILRHDKVILSMTNGLGVSTDIMKIRMTNKKRYITTHVVFVTMETQSIAHHI